MMIVFPEHSNLDVGAFFQKHISISNILIESPAMLTKRILFLLDTALSWKLHTVLVKLVLNVSVLTVTVTVSTDTFNTDSILTIIASRFA